MKQIIHDRSRVLSGTRAAAAATLNGIWLAAKVDPTSDWLGCSGKAPTASVAEIWWVEGTSSLARQTETHGVAEIVADKMMV